MIYAAAFLMCLFITLAVMRPLIKAAVKFGFVDKPTSRKSHKEPTPLVGGIAMFTGWCIVYSLFVGFSDIKLTAIFAGGFLILGIGVVDDFYKTRGKEFGVLPRAIVQNLAAVIVFAAGVRFTGFMNPFTDSYVLFPLWLQFALTVLWIFGVTTVINFSDGLDGLSGGLSFISGATLFITAIFMGQSDSAVMAVILLGCIAGFLKYNITPAKTFAGDSGANFMGYALAVIALYGAFKQATVISVFVPVLALGLPIFDNILLVLRRLKARESVFKADAGQIHHRLVRSGLKPKQAVLFLFLISICLNLTSIILLLL